MTHADKRNFFNAIVVCVLIASIVAFIYYYQEPVVNFYTDFMSHDPALYIGPASVMLIGLLLIRPVLVMATWKRPIVPVFLVTGVWIAVAIFTSFYVLVNLQIDETTREYLARYFSIPTIMIASWVAGMGWFVHQHFTFRGHRMANAFNVLMQFQTSHELREAHKRVSRTIPHDCDPYIDITYRESRHRLRCLKELSDCKINGNKSMIEAAREKSRESLAIQDMMYLLNYFEFIAVGIDKRELDNDILYETMRPILNVYYARASLFIEEKNRRGEKTFQALKRLHDSWAEDYANEVAGQKKPTPVEGSPAIPTGNQAGSQVQPLAGSSG